MSLVPGSLEVFERGWGSWLVRELLEGQTRDRMPRTGQRDHKVTGFELSRVDFEECRHILVLFKE